MLRRRRADGADGRSACGSAIAAVVSLLGIAWGFERSFLTIYESKGIDLVVVQAGVSDRLTSNLDARPGRAAARRCRAWPHVAPLADGRGLVRGGEPRQRPGQRLGAGEPAVPGHPRPRRAGALRPGDGQVGDARAGPGPEPGQEGRRRRSTSRASRSRWSGIFESDSLFENGGLIVPLAELQKMMGREGQVTGLRRRGRGRRPRVGRGAGAADRGGDPGRRGGPGARLRPGRHPDPAGQGDGLGDVGRSPWCSARSGC